MRFLVIDAGKAPAILRYLFEYKPKHDIEEASTLAEGTYKLRNSEPFDAVLMGLHLPNGAGEEAFRRVQAAADPTPIVVLSTREHDTEEELKRLSRLGMAGHVWRDHADAKQILGELIVAAENARHTARLMTDESEVIRESERAIQKLRDSDRPMADVHRTSYLAMRQLFASMGAMREELHHLRARDHEHDKLLDTGRHEIREVQKLTEALEAREKELREGFEVQRRRLEAQKQRRTAGIVGAIVGSPVVWELAKRLLEVLSGS